MQPSNSTREELADAVRARLNADLDRLLRSRRDPGTADPVDSALRASGALFAIGARTIVDALDVLTLPQYTTMTALSLGPLTHAQLVAHPDAMVRELDGLVAAGWVRETTLTSQAPAWELTVHGSQLVAQIAATREAEVTQILDQLAQHDRDAVAHGLAVFAAAAEDALATHRSPAE